MITLQHAKNAMEAATNKAKALGTAITVVVVDEHGSIIAVSRMDGAIPISPRFAYTKAFTAASLGAPTGALEKFAEEGKPYMGLNDIFGGELTTIKGGLPVSRDGRILGGVGVGGSMDVNQDEECAKAAVDVLVQ
jgi:uncharacterized protein GlcG (DUF336 family)